MTESIEPATDAELERVKVETIPKLRHRALARRSVGRRSKTATYDERLDDVAADDLEAILSRLTRAERERDEARAALKPYALSVAPDPKTLSGWRFGTTPTSADAIRAYKTYAALQAPQP